MKLIFAALLIAIGVNLVPSESDSYLVAYLREHSQTPVEYVMAKATSHSIIIIGEAHPFGGAEPPPHNRRQSRKQIAPDF